MLRRGTRIAVSVLTMYLVGVLANVAVAGPVSAPKIADKMKRIIASNWTCKNLQVKVVPFENDAYTQAGRFSAIVFQADEVDNKGVVTAPVYIKAFDATVDMYALYYKDKISITKRKNTAIEAKVSEQSLNTMIARKKDLPIKNARVDLGNGIMTCTGDYQAVVGHKLMMQAKFVVENSTKINLVPTKVTVNGIPLPAGPVKSLLAKLNPILDLTKMPLSPTLDTVTITDTHIILKDNV